MITEIVKEIIVEDCVENGLVESAAELMDMSECWHYKFNEAQIEQWGIDILIDKDGDGDESCMDHLLYVVTCHTDTNTFDFYTGWNGWHDIIQR